MSWEESSRLPRPCVCGQGTWAEVTETDDWNRSRSYAEINCPACRKTHRIEEIPGLEKGRATVSHRLVPRDGKPDAPRRL